jgi:hypothetical protein
LVFLQNMTDIIELLPAHFSPKSKVWIYQADRIYGLAEALQVEEKLENFVAQWKSHGTPVEAFANLFYGRFIILIVNADGENASGCSIDGSVRLIKELETTFNNMLTNRLNLAFNHKEKIEVIPYNQCSYALQNGLLAADSLFFDNSINTLQQLQTKWLVPIENSWLGKKLQLVSTNKT